MSNGDYRWNLDGLIIFCIIGLIGSLVGFGYLIYWLINHIKII